MLQVNVRMFSTGGRRTFAWPLARSLQCNAFRRICALRCDWKLWMSPLCICFWKAGFMQIVEDNVSVFLYVCNWMIRFACIFRLRHSKASDIHICLHIICLMFFTHHLGPSTWEVDQCRRLNIHEYSQMHIVLWRRTSWRIFFHYRATEWFCDQAQYVGAASTTIGSEKHAWPTCTEEVVCSPVHPAFRWNGMFFIWKGLSKRSGFSSRLLLNGSWIVLDLWMLEI